MCHVYSLCCTLLLCQCKKMSPTGPHHISERYGKSCHLHNSKSNDIYQKFNLIHSLPVLQLKALLSPASSLSASSCQSVFNDSIIFACTKDKANAGILVWLLYIPVQCFKIQVQLSKMLWTEHSDFKLNGHEA